MMVTCRLTKLSVLVSRTSFPSFSSSLKIISFVPSRLASSNTAFEVKERHISKNMLLRQIDRGPRENRQLVLLFEWLFAKPAARTKYCNLYHEKGMDVLVISGKLRHFLWPPAGFKLVEKVLDYIMKERSGRKKFLVHAFSVGAYIYTLLMIHSTHVENFGKFKNNVEGQVFDSVVIGSYDNMSTGIASAFTRNKVLRSSTLCLMNMYYNMTRRHTRDRYDEFVHYFIHNPIQVPTLIFYALNDPMSDPEAMKNLLRTWEEEFPLFDVEVKCWEKSVHAAHIKFHEEEYIENWNKFLRKISQSGF